MAIRFFNITLAALIFISSSGFMVNSHFCQNQLQSISIFLQPKSCHNTPVFFLNTGTKKCCKPKPARENENCCHNEKEYVKLDLNQYLFKQYLKEKKDNFIGHFPFYYQPADTFFALKKIPFYNYKPPLIELDFQTVFQVFLC